MTVEEAVVLAIDLIGSIAAQIKDGEKSYTTADLLARIKADEAGIATDNAADDAAAQSELDKRFPT